MKHTTEAHLLITTFVGSACLIAGFIMGACFVLFGERLKRPKRSDKYQGKI